ncbi:aspartyl protease family protein [Dyella sp. 2HG41-7]|uniref:aspartyl protease family protein n=1 Tax=Dyella sp. 2HG41-7 TaxID=2883239 RepID=UPI001F2ACDA7|nr:aspartyl protease family protein [Dyella sp. 2HG41-7]
MNGEKRFVAGRLAIGILRVCCLGIGLLLASQARAAKCQLMLYGTLPVDLVGGRATTVVKINGTDTHFIIDTGAFFNNMSRANASSLGLKLRDLPDNFRLIGVGGSANAQYTHVKEFGILGTTLKNIDFIVGGSDAGTGLLGANLFDFADLEIDFAHGKLSFFKVDNCDNSALSYWATGRDYFMVKLEPSGDRFDQRTFVDVMINGKKVHAVLDSGSMATLISRHAAERAGLDLNAPNVKKGYASGIGQKTVQTWIVPVDSFSVGTETIQHSEMEVIDGTFGDINTDMLLGLDYLLAHHMFISNSQKMAYFTYNGGRVFAFADATGDGDKSNAGTATDNNGAASKNASDFALRGEADLSRGEPQTAITDLNEAIRLAPDQADYYVARARAFGAAKQSDAALTDLNKALSLDPKNLDGLLLRARVHFMHKDRAGAAADVAAASALAPAGSSRSRAVAAMYIELDQPASALPLLDDWIRLHSSDSGLGVVLNERCWARALSNQMLDDALHDCRKAIKRDGENAAYLDSLGLVQLRLGHYPESIKAYEQATAGNPRSAWSRYGLGLAKIRSGQAEAGKADLVAAQALDPNIETRAAKYGLAASGP